MGAKGLFVHLVDNASEAARVLSPQWQWVYIGKDIEQRAALHTLGYQHGAGLSRFNLAYFHGTVEAETAPLPDLIIASGAYAYGLLAEGGTSHERLVLGGNLAQATIRRRVRECSSVQERA